MSNEFGGVQVEVEMPRRSFLAVELGVFGGEKLVYRASFGFLLAWFFPTTLNAYKRV